MQQEKSSSTGELVMRWDDEDALPDYFHVTYAKTVTNVWAFLGVTVFAGLFILWTWSLLHPHQEEYALKVALGLLMGVFAVLGTATVLLWCFLFAILPLGPGVLARRLDRSANSDGWSVTVTEAGITVAGGSVSRSWKWEETEQVSVRRIRHRGPVMNFYANVICLQSGGPGRETGWPVPLGWPSRDPKTLDRKSLGGYVPLCVLGPLAPAERRSLYAAFAAYGRRYWWPPDD